MSPIILICDIPLNHHQHDYFYNGFLKSPCYACGQRDHSLLNMVEIDGLITDYCCPVVIHKPINKYLPSIDTYLDFYIDNYKVGELFDYRFEAPLQNALACYRRFGVGRLLEEADYAKVVTEISRICTEGMKNLTTTETTQEPNGK
jgi:hypothetical protein